MIKLSKLYQAVVETMNQGVCLLNPEGSIVFVNGAYANLIGQPKESLLGRPLTDFLTAEGIQAFKQKGNDSEQYELSYRHGESLSPVHCIVTPSLLLNVDDSLTYTLCMHTDISDSKRLDRELNLSLQRLEKAQRMAHLGFWEVDLLTQKTMWSDELFRIFGFDPKKGSPSVEEYSKLIHPDDYDRVMTRRKQGIADGKPYTIEFRMFRADGKLRHIMNSCKSEKDAMGNTIRFFGIAFDISERVQRETLIAAKNAQIAASSKLASLGEMASGIAHEINNPLAIISGKAQIFTTKLEGKEPVDKDKLLDHLLSIEETTKRIAKIVSGLKFFSRDSNSDQFEFNSIRKIVDQTLCLCTERFRNNNIDLKVAKIPEVIIECRASEMSQVLLSLLNNAFDAAIETQNRWIRLDFKEYLDSIEFLISDSGKGIEKSIQGKIMDPFFTTKPIGRATGLGLSIASGIMAKHNGSVSLVADSSNTEFQILLPKRQRKLARAAS